MHLLTHAVCALTVATMGVLSLAPPAQAATWRVPAPDYSVNPAHHPNEYENRVVAKVNEKRVRAGLSRLRVYQSCLDGKSDSWARRLAEMGRLEHRNQRGVLADCNLHWTGETVALGSRSSMSPGDLVSAWMHSPDHRAILMTRRANKAGVGIRFDSRGNLYAVVNLGDPT